MCFYFAVFHDAGFASDDEVKAHFFAQLGLVCSNSLSLV